VGPLPCRYLVPSLSVNNNNQLVTFVVGGVVILIVFYTMREYLVLALVGAGAIHLYKLASDPKDRNRRH
jgi:hypothetical protein